VSFATQTASARSFAEIKKTQILPKYAFAQHSNGKTQTISSAYRGSRVINHVRDCGANEKIKTRFQIKLMIISSMPTQLSYSQKKSLMVLSNSAGKFNLKLMNGPNLFFNWLTTVSHPSLSLSLSIFRHHQNSSPSLCWLCLS
jgi:hypothetical protein